MLAHFISDFFQGDQIWRFFTIWVLLGTLGANFFSKIQSLSVGLELVGGSVSLF